MEDNLQFDKAEFDAPSVNICANCSRPLSGSYFQAGGRSVCEDCAEKFRQHFSAAGSGVGPALAALLFGVGAAVLGGGVYGAVMVFAHSEWGIISIGVGIIVGRAVRKGSGGVGGVFYQWLAAILTYAAIAGAYAFAVYHQMPSPSPAAIIALVLMAYRLPFMGGAENAIGLLIIGFGVWQAWRLNRGATLNITGPHALTPPKAASGV